MADGSTVTNHNICTAIVTSEEGRLTGSLLGGSHAEAPGKRNRAWLCGEPRPTLWGDGGVEGVPGTPPKDVQGSRQLLLAQWPGAPAQGSRSTHGLLNLRANYSYLIQTLYNLRPCEWQPSCKIEQATLLPHLLSHSPRQTGRYQLPQGPLHPSRQQA